MARSKDSLAPRHYSITTCVVRLEVELQSNFDDAMTVFVGDLAKIVQRIRSEMIPFTRIADIPSDKSARAVRNGGSVDRNITGCVQSQVDVTVVRVRDINPGRICLVEYVEETASELNRFRFADLEVLEERYVKITAAWQSHIERRRQWSRRSHLLRNRDLTNIEDLGSYLVVA